MSEFEVWSRALKQALPEAERRMDIRLIITKLDSNNLLNYYEYAEVEGIRNRIEKTRKVFQFIGNKDTPYIHKFVYILETSDGFEHWARTIKEYAGVPVTEVVGSGNLTPAKGGTPSTPAQSGGVLGPSEHRLHHSSSSPASQGNSRMLPPAIPCETPVIRSRDEGPRRDNEIVRPIASSRRSPIQDQSLSDQEDVDGQGGTHVPPPGSGKRREVNFSGKRGEHMVEARIWDDLESAVVCIQPNSVPGTAFIANDPNDGCILLSALHCFLEGTAYDLQEDNPAELKQMIDDSNGGLLRDCILRYYYWFCYKERDQHVELKGSDFVAEHVGVEYDVKRDIISFPVDIDKIKRILHDKQIHPIELGNVKSASDAQGEPVELYWTTRTARAYGFPSGRPLASSGGEILEYIEPTDVETERIAYEVRTEGSSSGGPVFVTFGDNHPVVVAIHCQGGTLKEGRNYGTLLSPFLQEHIFKED